MQLKVAGEALVTTPPPRVPEDVEVLAPNRKYLTAFPKKTAYVLLAAVIAALPAPLLPSTAQQTLQVVAVLFAIYPGLRLGAWVEHSLYAVLNRKNFFLRVVSQGAFSFVFFWVTILLSAVLLASDYLSIAGVALFVGGMWGAISAVGSIVIMSIDVLASATSKSFRVRVAWAVLGLIGTAMLFAFGLAVIAVKTAKAAAFMDTKGIKVTGVSNAQAELIREQIIWVLSEPMLALVIVFVLATALLTPAIVSAAVKFADAVMDRIYPMTEAFTKIGTGNRRVRLEEGGSQDFVDLARAFNVMVARLSLAERMERAFGVYVSGHVMEKIKAQHGEAILPPALKDATVFFADIRGFTSLSEKLSPDAMVSVLNRYFEQAVSVIETHDGYLNKFIGDAIVVVFNGPIDQTDHAERAVKCAIALQQKVAELNARGAFPEIGELRIGIGVSTGAMTCGNIGSARQMEYTVIGDTVNLAARLTSHANAAEVWISDATAKLLPASYGAAALPPIRLKGKEHEVTPWRVSAAFIPQPQPAVA